MRIYIIGNDGVALSREAAMHRAIPVSADRAAPAGPAHPREKPAFRRGRAKSRETWTVRWRELDSNLRFRARVVSVLLLRDQMLASSSSSGEPGEAAFHGQSLQRTCR